MSNHYQDPLLRGLNQICAAASPIGRSSNFNLSQR